MNSYSIKIEIPKGRLETIFKKLDRAQSMIRECYMELESLGVVKFKEESSQKADSLSFTCDKMPDK